MFLEILIFKILYSLKLCPFFVGSVHNFGKSDNAMTRFSEKMLIFTRCIHGFMSNLLKKSWTDSDVCRKSRLEVAMYVVCTIVHDFIQPYTE